MKFNYEEWESKVLAFLNIEGYPTKEEESLFCDLLEEADYSNDVSAIELLLLIFVKYDLNLDETFYGTLSTMDYKVYYETYFKNVHKLINLNEDSKYKIVDLVDCGIRNLTDNETEIVLSFVLKYLNHIDMNVLLEVFIEWNYHEDSNTNPLVIQILDIIKQTLKEAGKL